MINIPEVKVGIVAVSRDCFPESLSVNRRKALIDRRRRELSGGLFQCPPVAVRAQRHGMAFDRQAVRGRCRTV